MAKYIDREAAYRFAQDQIKKETGAYSRGWNHALGVMKGALHNNDAIPTADVVPVRHGRWVLVGADDMDEGMFKCSECGSENFFPEILMGIPADNYCPNCGARMDGDS